MYNHTMKTRHERGIYPIVAGWACRQFRRSKTAINARLRHRKKADSAFATTSRPAIPILTRDEKRAIEIVGKACHDFVKDYGLSLVEVTSDSVIYRGWGGYEITLRSDGWTCKPPDGKEFSGVGHINLSGHF